MNLFCFSLVGCSLKLKNMNMVARLFIVIDSTSYLHVMIFFICSFFLFLLVICWSIFPLSSYTHITVALRNWCAKFSFFWLAMMISNWVIYAKFLRRRAVCAMGCMFLLVISTLTLARCICASSMLFADLTFSHNLHAWCASLKANSHYFHSFVFALLLHGNLRPATGERYFISISFLLRSIIVLRYNWK